MPLDEFNDYFKVGLSCEAFDTIGGFVTHQFGHLPKPGETIELEQFMFKVTHADNRRIRLLECRLRSG